MFDLITIGRSNMDLFSMQIGAEFVETESFAAQVGGSPTNIAIGTAQLGLRSAALTAVGHDLVGDFIINYLQKKGVDTSLIVRKPGLSSLALLGVKPPDQFPLLFYRENPPDIWINIDDIPDLKQTKAFLISGTALSRGTCADATLYAAESARQVGCMTYLDLDLRPDQWSHPMAYGVAMRQVMPMVDVIIGTEEELWAAINREPEGWHGNTAVTDEERTAVENWITNRMASATQEQTIVLKRGKAGVTFFESGKPPIDVPGFSVEVLNTVGAGDAFASGLIYSRAQGKDWAESGRFGNVCGALVVTRHGCAEALPTLGEVEDFLLASGGMGSEK